jgi:hypothetical protein
MCKCGEKAVGTNCGNDPVEAVVEEKPACCGTSQAKETSGGCCSEKTA